MNCLRKKVIIRADGNSSIGLGHVVRCCALADVLKDNFDCYFYIRKPSQSIVEEIKQYCISVFEMDETISYEQEAVTWSKELQGNEIVVLDGYNFDTTYQQKIKSKGCKLVCIDDIYAYYFVADAVINHAPGILKEQYSCESYTKLFLGTDYVLLREIFLKKAARLQQIHDLDTSPILICLGGADPQNVTLKVLDQVSRYFCNRKMFVVVGAAYSYKDSLDEYIKNNNQLHLFMNISSEELVALMEKAHIAVTSASTIALEYLCIKGNLFLLATANNQSNLYNSLIEKKCAYPFELLNDNYNSDAVIQYQYALIDGKSREHILKIFTHLIYP